MAQSPIGHRVSQPDTTELKEFRDRINHDLPRLKGRIRKLKSDKGFGFIAGHDGIDYFFHWSVVIKSSGKEFRELEQRDLVEFSPIKPPDNEWRAIEVTFVSESLEESRSAG